MDDFVLGLYLFATFIGGVTTGVAGFAAGLVVSGVWLHIITPTQTAVLIVGYALLTQSYSIWKLRHALSLRRLAPFIIGGTAGAPLGAMLLTSIDPAHLRLGIGVLLVIYSVYNLARPALKPLPGNVAADVGIGFFNGLLGGLTGLGGIIVTVWCPTARLAQGCPTRRFPACHSRGRADQRDILCLGRSHHGGNGRIISTGTAGACGRSVAWLQALWKTR
jgi:uncharacterized membrane protein YfcA